MLREYGKDRCCSISISSILRKQNWLAWNLAQDTTKPLPEGTYVVTGRSMFQLIQAVSLKKRFSKGETQKISIASLAPSPKDLIFVKELLKPGRSSLSLMDVTRLLKLRKPSGILRKNTPEEKSLSVSIDHLYHNLRKPELKL